MKLGGNGDMGYMKLLIKDIKVKELNKYLVENTKVNVNEYMDMFILSYINGYNIREIAELHEVKYHKVYRILNRCYKILKLI